MPTMLFNPTKEEMRPMFNGITITIPPEGKVKVEDPAANHILSHYATRGLCRLDFGDDEAKVAKEGLIRNYEFRKRMVMKHNQTNMARAQLGMTYLPPGDIVKQYARELNLVLDEPFTVQANNARTERDAENESLRERLAALTAQVEALMAASASASASAPKPKKER
jgi:hypothetical protein